MTSSPAPKKTLLDRFRIALEMSTSVAVIVGVVLVVLRGYSGSRISDGPRSREIPVPAQPLSLDGVAGIGDAAAKVVLLEFSDFECPYCEKFGTDVLPILAKSYIETGRMRLAFRHLPLSIHPNAAGAAAAATCAGEQNRFAAFHDRLFGSPKQLAEADLAEHASAVGLDLARFKSCVKATAPARLDADRKLAASLGVTATPAFFVGTVNQDGQLVVKRTVLGAKPASDFKTIIDELLAGQ